MAGVRSTVTLAYSLAMPIFRKRADRIRGVAGSLEGTTALVMDGTCGAGPGITKVIAEAGAAVFLAGPHSPTIDVQLHTLANSPIEVTPIVVDARTDRPWDQFLGSIDRPVDIAILNPTTTDLGQDAQLGPQGTVALAEAISGQMQDRGHPGSIVLVTGIRSAEPQSSAVAYLNAEMQRLARRLAANAIRVNAVAPGPIGTNRRGNPLSSRATPLGHVTLHPVEVGKAAWFLVNDDLSSAITGSTLKTDRGASLLAPEW